MKSIFTGILALSLLSSCASYQTYKGSREIVLTRKVMELKSDAKTKGMFLDEVQNGGTPSQLPFSIMEVIKERPWLAAGAGALDIGTAVLLKSGYDSMTDSDSSSSTPQASASADRNVAGGNQVIIQGNAGGDINVNIGAQQAEPGLGATPGFETPVGQ